MAEPEGDRLSGEDAAKPAVAHALPSPGAVRRILLWHQGGLGDLLLSGPALSGIAAAFPAARLAAVGYPERWWLFQDTLPLTDFWNSSEACWSSLYQEGGPLPPALARRLAGLDLAFILDRKSVV